MKIWYNKLYVQTIPLATFEDLKEAMSLIEHNNGVRPYILKWYHEVFYPAYNSKNGPDSRETKYGTLFENRTAVTTRNLIEKTAELQNMRLGNKQILETYLNPLLNLNIISRQACWMGELISIIQLKLTLKVRIYSIMQGRIIFLNVFE